MKRIVLITFCLFLIASCQKKEDKYAFYNAQDRTGIWVNPDLDDTLDIISTHQLIRKQDYNYQETFFYRIEKDELFLTSADSTHESTHEILSVKATEVELDNMYLSAGFAPNSGHFIKI